MDVGLSFTLRYTSESGAQMARLPVVCGCWIVWYFGSGNGTIATDQRIDAEIPLRRETG